MKEAEAEGMHFEDGGWDVRQGTQHLGSHSKPKKARK